MTPKAAKAKATLLHSKIVRARGYCEQCNRVDSLQCAHIISRRYSATRTVLSNAFCLCAKCHMRFTEWPVEFATFVTQQIGEPTYRALQQRALEGTKVDWNYEVERLSNIWESIQEGKSYAS
jgi:hypothetical protein